jgi:carbamoyl-phosphate synthase large subunit
LWCEIRKFKISDFLLSEYLPGNDYAYESIWRNGKVLVAKVAERLEYINAEHRLSNVSSSPSFAKIVKDEGVLKLAEKAIRAVSKIPNGVFSMDFKQNELDELCVVEFNIGRFMQITPIFDLSGKNNIAEIYVKCVLNIPIDIEEPYDMDERYYLIREHDTLPTVKKLYTIMNLQ